MDSATQSVMDYCRMNDITVSQMLEAGSSLENIIGQLVLDKERLTKKLMEVAAIAPRKITANGTTYIYRCPDHLVPETL